jgi:hypothetical protein
VPLLPAGDSPEGRAASWAYTTTDPGASWAALDFNDSSWSKGKAGFGTAGTPALKVNTPWNTSSIWLRTTVEMPELAKDDQLTLRLFHDEDVEIFVNGSLLYRTRGYVTAYHDLLLDSTQRGKFKPGKNAIAIHCRQTGGGQGIDVGLGLLRAD